MHIGICIYIYIYICIYIYIYTYHTFHLIIYDGRNSFKLLKVIEDKDTAIKELTDKLEGYYTCTRFVCE